MVSSQYTRVFEQLQCVSNWAALKQPTRGLFDVLHDYSVVNTTYVDPVVSVDYVLCTILLSSTRRIDTKSWKAPAGFSVSGYVRAAFRKCYLSERLPPPLSCVGRASHATPCMSLFATP